ncbi:MAG: hypothetical protein ACI4BD_08920 [Paludibacteraceae bacterium]
MMKNLSLCVMCIVCLAVGLVSCKSDVDVIGTNDTITQSTLSKAHAYAVAESGLQYRVIEYTLAKDGTGTRVERLFGDGIATVDQTKQLTYALGDYQNAYATRLIDVVFADGATKQMVWEGGVLSDEEHAYASSKVADAFKTIYTDLSNTDWAYNEKTLWIDTIPMDSLKYDSVYQKVKDPVTGEILKNAAGGDSIAKVEKVDTVRWNEYDTIGAKTNLDIHMTLKRESNANIGSYVYDYKEYARDSVITHDSVRSVVNFHWGFASVTSAKKATVIGVLAADTVTLEISDFAKKDKVLMLEGKKLKLQ